ncbi:MAG: aminopeptidase P family protein [Rhizobiales bacterium]|nr:aminopeptidase P family protein [Hyphomicrobiales bacterium]
MAATDDDLLTAALASRGIRMSIDEIDDLLRGIRAAPRGHDPDAWLDLIAPPDAADLRDRLKARLDAPGKGNASPSPPVADRLGSLKSALAASGLDGFVLPLTDEHRNEYIPKARQRIAWLTGFTGSAGTLVVLGDRAVVFVDGRYTVQAQQQLDPDLFERAHLIETPPSKWLGDNLAAGQRLAYDANLHVKAEVERFQKACDKAGAKLVALDQNPIDGIWPGQPAMPIAPLDALDIRYAGEASDDKRLRMGRKVEEAGADVSLIGAPDSIAWLLNIRGNDVSFNPLTLAFALLHKDGAVEIFLDERKLRPGQTFGNAVAHRPIEDLVHSLDHLGSSGKKVLADPAWTNVKLTRRLMAAGARIIEGDEPCILAKAIKNPTELDGARAAQIRDGAAVTRFLWWLDEALGKGETITELAAAAALEAERRKDPLFRGPSFGTISAAGPNAALAHYHATADSNRTLEPGSLYLVDSGGQYPDATTDITRTIAVGTPTAEMKRHYTLVLKGHIAIDRAVFPTGTSGAQIDAFARQPLWQAGLDFDHGTGHGIGSFLCVHEGPARIARTGTVPLKSGMILSNEPGYYRTGAYGIRIENLMIVKALDTPPGGERELLGFENITRVPLDRRLIDATMLTADERAWIEAYHALVLQDWNPCWKGRNERGWSRRRHR